MTHRAVVPISSCTCRRSRLPRHLPLGSTLLRTCPERMPSLRHPNFVVGNRHVKDEPVQDTFIPRAYCVFPDDRRLVWWHLHAVVGPQGHPPIDVPGVETGRVSIENVIDRSSDSLLVSRLLT